MTTTLARRSPRPPAASLTGSLSLLAAVGSALLAVAHLGVEIPLLSALGPGGDRAVPSAAAAFTVIALLYTVLAIGAFARARWAWWAGLVVNVLVVAGGVRNYRGVASAIAILLAALLVVLLLSPGGRQAFLARRR
jgi:hypothetical protein